MQLKSKLLPVLFLIIFSCTKEEEVFNYAVEINNTSGAELEIKTYLEGELKNSISISNNLSGLRCEYKDIGFLGYRLTTCKIDSIKILFKNIGKGYIESINTKTNYDFPEGGLFGNNSKFTENSPHEFRFQINEADLQNAFDLPN